jgi:N-acetylmuramoyl-L-alanine amidase
MKVERNNRASLELPQRFPTAVWSCLLWLTLGLLTDLPSNGRCTPVEPTIPAGEWMSVSEWAKENGFKLTQLKETKVLSLTNSTAALQLIPDSQLGQISGVNVWLSHPITLRNGQACISTLDLKATIQPILFAGTAPARKPIRTICLDPGHGGKDNGGQTGEFLEKQYTLVLAREVENQMCAAGFKVVLTRTKDRFVELEDRPAFAKRHNADLFISLHFNVAPQGGARGLEVYCLTPANTSSTNARGKSANIYSFPGNRQDARNILLAYQLHKSLVTGLRAEDRGLRRARFAVLRTATMPAVLIEGGFLSDSEERKKIVDPKYLSRMAAAIVQGVLAYKQAVES